MATVTRTTRQTFTFLTSGPELSVTLPDELRDPPLMSAPLTIEFGSGYREYEFVPTRFDQGWVEDHRALGSFESPDGFPVEFVERKDDPPQWYLRWDLTHGSLYTHLREEEGPDWAEKIVPNLGISEGRDGVPYLLPEPPLARGVLGRPGYREEVSFVSDPVHGPVVSFHSPSYVTRGSTVEQQRGEFAIVRTGLEGGVEASVSTTGRIDVARELMTDVESSFTRGG